MAAKVTKLSEMLAKRRETLGSDTRFEWPVDDEKTLSVQDPRLADQEWQDEFAALSQQAERGKLSPSELNETVIEMFLDDEGSDLDQSGEYIDMFADFPSPLQAARELLMDAVNEWGEKSDPTRKSSRSTRRNSKRP